MAESKTTKKSEVTFESPARSKRVYSEDGSVVARFVDGSFTTSDAALVKVLDGLPDVTRVD